MIEFRMNRATTVNKCVLRDANLSCRQVFKRKKNDEWDERHFHTITKTAKYFENQYFDSVSLTNAFLLVIYLLIWKMVKMVKMKAQAQILNENVNKIPTYPIY